MHKILRKINSFVLSFIMFFLLIAGNIMFIEPVEVQGASLDTLTINLNFTSAGSTTASLPQHWFTYGTQTVETATYTLGDWINIGQTKEITTVGNSSVTNPFGGLYQFTVAGGKGSSVNFSGSIGASGGNGAVFYSNNATVGANQTISFYRGVNNPMLYQTFTMQSAFTGGSDTGDHHVWGNGSDCYSGSSVCGHPCSGGGTDWSEYGFGEGGDKSSVSAPGLEITAAGGGSGVLYHFAYGYISHPNDRAACNGMDARLDTYNDTSIRNTYDSDLVYIYGHGGHFCAGSGVWYDNNGSSFVSAGKGNPNGITGGYGSNAIASSSAGVNSLSGITGSFASNGGNPYITVKCNAKILDIKAPSRIGYDFVGWEVSNDGGRTFRDGDIAGAITQSNTYGYTYGGNGSQITQTTFTIYQSGCTIRAKWRPQPGAIAVSPNSQLGTDSLGIAKYNNDIHAQWVSNGYERFDTSVTINVPTIRNATAYFNANGGTSDVTNTMSTVTFSHWVTAHRYYTDAYNDDTYNYCCIRDILACAPCIYKGCDDCIFHGELVNNTGGITTYKFCDGNWLPGYFNQYRKSLVVAQWKGSWVITLPNAYRDGYVFTGWYLQNGTYVGMAGDTYDLSPYARNLTDVTLVAHWEPINIKILYIMNIPADSDANTSYNATTSSIQSHSLLNKTTALNGYHSFASQGQNSTGSYSFGSTSAANSQYSYIGSKTYTYDSNDWTLDTVPITVNDYYFTGYKIKDIAWKGYGGVMPNSNASIGTIIGGSIEAAYDTTADYQLKTLSLPKNAVLNKENNLPDTSSSNGAYKNYYKVDYYYTYVISEGNPKWTWLPVNANNTKATPQTDATNASAGAKASGLNKSQNTVNCTDARNTIYVVLEAQWSTYAPNTTIVYNSNNDDNATHKLTNAFTSLTQYIDLLPISSISNSGFGKTQSSQLIDSALTSAITTNDDGSYDKNATNDMFVVNKNGSDKYYSGKSNGRYGFFSFQGWSTWKYATWRDSIDSNKKDTYGNTNNQPRGNDGNENTTTYQANELIVKAYNDVARSKRVGDLYYRMSALMYPNTGYNNAVNNMNSFGNMINKTGTGDKFSTSRSRQIWNAYLWRWTQGSSGHYTIPMPVLKSDVTLYAIWDSYPTSSISNVYCYLDEIDTLTPGYLFGKVTATDFEDFWNQKNNAIGGTSDGSVDWNTVARAVTSNMNAAKASTVPAGDYTYRYDIASNNAYLGGSFTATLCDYDYNKFVNAAFIDDIASVSLTWKFVDSAGNTTYKTSWVYIIDRDDTRYVPPGTDPNDYYDSDGDDYSDDNSHETDNTRYSITRFISEENYKKALFDTSGNYVVDSANEADGSLLKRSKWYLVSDYRNEILSAFDRLETIGDSSLVFDYKNFTAGWTGDYHPQLNSSTGEWEYDFDAIKAQTKGIYVYDYDDIMNSKKFTVEHGLDTGNFTSTSYSTLAEYINKIFKSTAILSIQD